MTTASFKPIWTQIFTNFVPLLLMAVVVGLFNIHNHIQEITFQLKDIMEHMEEFKTYNTRINECEYDIRALKEKIEN